MNTKLIKALFCLNIGFAVAVYGRASEAMEELNNHQKITINAGNYRITLEQTPAWTYREVSYNNSALLIPSGWAQTVLNIKKPGDDQWIGTGHGREVVTSVELFEDEQSVPFFADEDTYDFPEESVITIVKHSIVGPYAHKSVLELSRTGFTQNYFFEVTGDTSLVNYVYACMLIFPNEANKWIVGFADSRKLTGTLPGTKANEYTLQQDKVSWLSMRFSDSELAAVIVWSRPLDSRNQKGNFFVDRANDNKYYCQIIPPLKPGEKIEYSLKMHCAEADDDSFPSVTEKLVREISSDLQNRMKKINNKSGSGNESSSGKKVQTSAGNSAAGNANEKAARIERQVTGPKDFTVIIPDENNARTVSSEKFGFSEKNDGYKNFHAMVKAVEYCRINNYQRITVPKGAYTIRSPEGWTNSSGIKIEGMTNFIFDGSGSCFTFQDHEEETEQSGGFLNIVNSRHIQIKNLFIDWDWNIRPLAYIGTIVQTDPANNTIDFDLDDQNGKWPVHKSLFNIGKPGGIDYTREWDPEIKNRSPKGFAFWAPANCERDKGDIIGRNRIRLYFKTQAASIVKNAQISRQSIFYTRAFYKAQGINIMSNEHISISNVVIYGATAGGIAGLVNKYLEIVNCKIIPRPERGPFRPSESGLEIHMSRGFFRLQGCEIAYTTDDQLHMSDWFAGGGVRRIGDYTLRVTNLMMWQHKWQFFEGGRLEFRNLDYSSINFTATIKSFHLTEVPGRGNHFYDVKTAEKIPANIPEDALLFNQEFGRGQFIIRDNYFHHGVCKILYIGIPNGLIENNRFEYGAYNAISVHSLTKGVKLHMGYPPTNIIIRGNSINNCQTAESDEPPAIFAGGGHSDREERGYAGVAYPVARNIIIENNTIENDTFTGIGIWSAKNILIRNNKFKNIKKASGPASYPSAGSMTIHHASDVVIINNTLEKPSDLPGGKIILIDPLTTENILAADNKGFEIAD